MMMTNEMLLIVVIGIIIVSIIGLHHSYKSEKPMIYEDW